MDTDNDEQTLFEITEGTAAVSAIEKPKRVATQRQLDALAKAREVRAAVREREQREDAEQEIPKTKKQIIVPEVPKPKKKRKPTVIQFQDASDSDEDDAPVIIIKNKKRPPAPEPKLFPEPVPVPVEPKLPKQFIRKAY